MPTSQSRDPPSQRGEDWVREKALEDSRETKVPELLQARMRGSRTVDSQQHPLYTSCESQADEIGPKSLSESHDPTHPPGLQLPSGKPEPELSAPWAFIPLMVSIGLLAPTCVRVDMASTLADLNQWERIAYNRS